MGLDKVCRCLEKSLPNRGNSQCEVLEAGMGWSGWFSSLKYLEIPSWPFRDEYGSVTGFTSSLYR